MPHPISYDGLTDEQIDILTVLYSCDSYDELMGFVGELDIKTQRTAMSLIQLILHETIEDDIRKMTSYPDAERLLGEIQRKFN